MSLFNKYRPTTFEEVYGQNVTTTILSRQIECDDISNVYLFSGSSGCGKTTVARIFASMLNGGLCEPIEIDAASNNGVDNVRSIVESAAERSVSGKYKVFIIDECHLITSAGWSAFLKCIEEPPKYTIFIFCTTDIHKVPETIYNRCMVFNFNKISSSDIVKVLNNICEKEHFRYDDYALEYIARLSDGKLRDAVVNLDKCRYFGDITLNNVESVLGNNHKDYFVRLMDAIIDGENKNIHSGVTGLETIMKVVDELDAKGVNFSLVLNDFIKFCLNVNRCLILGNINQDSIIDEASFKSITNFDGAASYYNYVIDKLLLIKEEKVIDKFYFELKIMQIARRV